MRNRSALLFSAGWLFFLIFCSIFNSCNPPDTRKTIKLTVEVNLGEFIRMMSNNPNDSILNNAIHDTYAARSASTYKFMPLFWEILQKNNPGINVAQFFVKPHQHDIYPDESNSSVIAKLNKEAGYAMEHTYDAIDSRLRNLVSDAKTVYDSDMEVIRITFKGKEYFERVRSSLLKNGDLQFFETYTNAEMFPMLQKANDTLASFIPDTGEPISDDTDTEQDTAHHADNDTGGLNSYLGKRSRHTQSKEGKESLKKYPLYRVLQPNVTDHGSQLAQGPVVGYALAKDTATLNKYLSYDAVRSVLPPLVHFIYAENSDRHALLPIYAVKVPEDGTLILDGSYVANAKADISKYNDAPCVILDMNQPGKVRWAKMTAQNVGKYIAIVFDGKVYSCPRVDNEIATGHTEISGSFSMEQAQDYANILKSGKLPLPVRIIESNIND